MAALAAADRLDLGPARNHRQIARRHLTWYQVRRICGSDVIVCKDNCHIVMLFRVLRGSRSRLGGVVGLVVVLGRSRP